MHNQKSYKIGTRGSLLALTQCNQVKDQLEALTGDKFELEIIKTQGDLITSAPLWQLDGKDFFTKELDEALISGKVDLVVHSYKDLGSERPAPITLAAITKRNFAHDILLIKKSTIERLSSMTDFVVGTSSPRRMYNLSRKLHEFIPNGNNLTITTKVLRGNVNTRIQKLNNDEFDAIVLALPGIERLALTESSRLELTALIQNLNFMILPQSTFPSSASQGALGIECLKERTDHGELYKKLKLMEDAITVSEVSRERKAFTEYGGGCHLAVGINVQKIHDFFVHIHRGELNNQAVNKTIIEGRTLPALNKETKYFVGMPKSKWGHVLHDEMIIKKALNKTLASSAHYFVTSRHAITEFTPGKNPLSLWASGNKTFKELCKKGLWVNGSSDGLGLSAIEHFKHSRVISLFFEKADGPLKSLTNHDSETTIKAYEREIVATSHDFDVNILNRDVFYWTSFYQYQMYCEKYPSIKGKRHATGMGKTYQQFKEHSIEVLPFYSLEDFENWMQENGK